MLGITRMKRNTFYLNYSNTIFPGDPINNKNIEFIYYEK